MPIDLKNIKSGYNLTAINENFQKIEQAWDEKLDRIQSLQGNQMEQDLDLNGYRLLNPSEDSDFLTEEKADERYVNVDGDSMQGPLHVQTPTAFSHAAQHGKVVEVDNKVGAEASARIAGDLALDNRIKQESDARKAADANLQSQISGGVELEASAFSPISWHKQTIDNSVEIPSGVNAWSFGPVMEISEGQEVTIGEGSFWTIANGKVVE